MAPSAAADSVDTPPRQALPTVLADTSRVSVVGDLSTRPRVCASVYGGMIALFLPPWQMWWPH
jgi:hypothetical protein